MTQITFKTDAAFEGSCLQGAIDVSYADLVACFGEHNCDGDGCKVQAEWSIKFSDGTYATIYDWKESKHYTKVRDWHIGGMSAASVERVKAAMAEHYATA